jgi:hypothetical protein
VKKVLPAEVEQDSQYYDLFVPSYPPPPSQNMSQDLNGLITKPIVYPTLRQKSELSFSPLFMWTYD